jgi:hypothetical protein
VLEDAQKVKERAYQDKQMAYQGKQLEHAVEMAKLQQKDYEAEIENWKAITKETKDWQDRVTGGFMKDGVLTTTFMTMVDTWEARFWEAINSAGGGGTERPPTEDQPVNPNRPPVVKPPTVPAPPPTPRPYPKDPEGWDGMSAAGARRDTAGPICVQVYLGADDVTDVIATRITRSQAFENGLTEAQRRQRNRGYN